MNERSAVLLMLIFSGFIVWSLTRGLRTGVMADDGLGSACRADRPGKFWLIAALEGLMLIACLGLGIAMSFGLLKY